MTIILLTMSCVLAGTLADLLLRKKAFGGPLNSVMLFVLLFCGLLAYNRLFQDVRFADPGHAMSFAIIFACAMFAGLAALKNRLLHN